jgi:lipopolysaccharide/colanic/teichoic acid biosynthesis glycosyltransferase
MSTNLWTAEKWKEAEQAYLKKRKDIKIRLHLAFKRLLDVNVSATVCLIILPILIIVALAVRLSSPGPILFCQKRMGKLAKPFYIYKFRTMVDGAIHQGVGLDSFKVDPRITSVGKFLREYHLDELPQLLNVFLGDMSLVGPRPLLDVELPTYSESERQRLFMLPGITGWQQINGGELNDIDERLKLDVWYIDHWTSWLDIVIILKTIPVVLRKEGVYAADGWRRSRVPGQQYQENITFSEAADFRKDNTSLNMTPDKKTSSTKIYSDDCQDSL